MSDRGKKSRADGRAKASKLSGGGDPRTKVDASSWEPGAPMNTTAKTGLRPIRPRTYKHGGKVQGDRAAPKRADKTPRKQLPEVVGKVNRDVKEANAEKFGRPHIGGMKTGGRAKKMGGGPMMDPNAQVPKDRMSFSPTGGSSMMGRKRGGATPAGDGPSMKAGDRVPRASGGYSRSAVDKEISKDKRIKSGEANAIRRLLKGRQQYDEPPAGMDKSFFNKPWPAASDDERQRGGRTKRADGGRTKAKGKTNINIVIGAPAGAQQTPPGPIKPPPAPPMMPPGGPPAPPPGPPPGMPMGGPPGMPPGDSPGMPPPPQMRKAGGRTIHPTAGAGSGLGRLQKTHFEERK